MAAWLSSLEPKSPFLPSSNFRARGPGEGERGSHLVGEGLWLASGFCASPGAWLRLLPVVKGVAGGKMAGRYLSLGR